MTATKSDVVKMVEIMDAFTEPQEVTARGFDIWMESDDINVLGALLHLIDVQSAELMSDTNPVIAVETVFTLNRRLFELALKNDIAGPQSRFAFSAYEAGRALSDFVKARHNEIIVDVIANDLAHLARMGSIEQRQCIVQSVLEHLFEDAQVRVHFEHFEHWTKDSLLRRLLDEADDWASSHQPTNEGGADTLFLLCHFPRS